MIYRVLTKSDGEFLKHKREEVAKNRKVRLRVTGILVNKTAQKENGRRANRIYEQTQNIWPIYQKPVKHKVIWLQIH